MKNESQAVSYCHHLDPDMLLGEGEAAVLLSVTPRCLTSWRQRRMGPPWVRIGNRAVRYKRRDLIEWVEQRREQVDAALAALLTQ